MAAALDAYLHCPDCGTWYYSVSAPHIYCPARARLREQALHRIRRLAAAYFADPSEKGNAARIADELRAALAEYHERFER